MKKLVIKDWKKSMAPTMPHVWKDTAGEIIILNSSNRNAWGQSNWLFDSEEEAKKRFEGVKKDLENDSNTIDPIAKALEEGTFDWEKQGQYLSAKGYLNSVDFENISVPYNEVPIITKGSDGYDEVKIDRVFDYTPAVKKEYTDKVFKAKAAIDTYKSRMTTLVLTPLAIDNLHLDDEETQDEVEGEWR